jgi:hypothetical protein
VIEDDRAQMQQPQQPTMAGAASGGAVASHVRQNVDRRVTQQQQQQQPAVFAPLAQAASAARAVNAGAPPGWLHEAVKGLVAKAAESAIKPQRS